jgi:hypothetical protein
MPRAEPRQHHRLPTFYLAGFTPSGREDGQLFVFDFVRRKTWRARPNKVAKLRDYYRVEVEGVDPNFAERLHHSFETRIAPILKRIRDTHTLPAGVELAYLIQFVALLDVRGENARERYRTAWLKTARDMLMSFLHDPEAFRACAEWLTNGQATIAEAPSAEAIEQFLVEHRELFAVSPSDAVRGTHRMVGEVTLSAFLERNWVLIEGGLSHGGFICSDEPVVVAPTDPGALLERVWKIADRHTDLTVPLDSDCALLGRYEGLDPIPNVTAKEVAAVNTRTFANDKHMVYSARHDFLILGPDGAPTNGVELFNRGLL